MYNSINNLIELFENAAALHEGVRLFRKPQYSVVSTIHSAWPNMVYSISESLFDQTSVVEITQLISLLGNKPILVTEESGGVLRLLRKNFILPADQWAEMEIALEQFIPDQTPISSDLSFFEPSKQNLDHISRWAKLVSECLFNNASLDMELFSKLSKIDQCQLISLMTGEKLIGTALIYFDKLGYAGLYMVCVDELYRGRGFGGLLIEECLRIIRSRGFKKCVLQSTKQGLPLYIGKGFSQKGNIYLLWKIK